MRSKAPVDPDRPPGERPDRHSPAGRKVGAPRAARPSAPFAIGRIVVGEAEQACLIRELSAAGLRIEMRRPPPAGARIWLECGVLPAGWAVVQWREDVMAGITLEKGGPATLPSAGTDEDRQSRTPRFPLCLPATLAAPGRRLAMAAEDISRGGLKLIGRHDLAVGTRAEVRLGDSLRALAGRVCWTGPDMLGFRFAAILPCEAMMAILDMATPPEP